MCLQVFTVFIQAESLFCNSVAHVLLVCSNTADEVTTSRNIGLRKGKNRKSEPVNGKQNSGGM